MINYYLITKPGIILGNLITFAGGFLLASKGHIELALFFETLLGLALIMASACVFNNYIDRKIDSVMERTKNRALVIGLIPESKAIAFAVALGLIGAFVLLFFTNLLTLAVAAIGFFVYVVLYSLWKGHTIYGTAIGSIAGAVPPVVGYCAVSNRIDLGSFILFAMLVLWQMPHFFSIALYHFDDYAAAKIPVLPLVKGILRTKVHMVLYILAFICSIVSLTLFEYAGKSFLIVSTLLSFIWLLICLQGFSRENNQQWGRDMFYYSLCLITGVCLMISFERLL